MNTQQLETFIQVAEQLNFARAAETLNVTQSAISRQIRALEEELGTKLFARTTRTVSLTPEGAIFLEHAKQILDHLQVAASRMEHRSSNGARVLRIGCESEGDRDFLCRVLRRSRQQIPDFHPLLRILPHRALLNLFFQGEVEVLFGIQEELPVREDFPFVPLYQLPLCCVMAPDHPLAGTEPIRVEELFSYPLALCSAYTVPTRMAALQKRIAQHLSPEQIYLCENAAAVEMLVRAGYGCAVLPRLRDGEEGLCCRPLAGVDPLTYGLCYSGPGDGLLRQFVGLAQGAVRRE